MECVAADLAQVGEEEGTAVVGDNGPGVVNDPLFEFVDDVVAEDGVFAWPVAGVEAAQLLEDGGAYYEIATGEVVAGTDTPRTVAVGVAAGDEGVGVSFAAEFGQPGGVEGCDTGAAGTADGGVGEVGGEVGEPFGTGGGVVVNKGDKRAVGNFDAEVTFFGGADMAGGDDAEVGLGGGGDFGGGIGEDDCF